MVGINGLGAILTYGIVSQASDGEGAAGRTGGMPKGGQPSLGLEGIRRVEDLEQRAFLLTSLAVSRNGSGAGENAAEIDALFAEAVDTAFDCPDMLQSAEQLLWIASEIISSGAYQRIDIDSIPRDSFERGKLIEDPEEKAAYLTHLFSMMGWLCEVNEVEGPLAREAVEEAWSILDDIPEQQRASFQRSIEDAVFNLGV
ncbi:MAG: hypothetical protein HQ596_03805 [Candidatus Saganbacteria bacterium]|nr:hypothetical protein [Candidatus Saganbacteria bacterium]